MPDAIAISFAPRTGRKINLVEQASSGLLDAGCDLFGLRSAFIASAVPGRGAAALHANRVAWAGFRGRCPDAQGTAVREHAARGDYQSLRAGARSDRVDDGRGWR